MAVKAMDSRIGNATRQVREHVTTPVYREGYALVMSAAVAGVLGLVYWVVAARSYSPEDVGVNSAMISTMLLLSSIAQLNLSAGLIRFIPAAGASKRRLVAWSYGISVVSSGVLALGFLVVLRFVEPDASLVTSGRPFALWFVVSTAMWSLFNLQDAVLTGLRRAIWVPVDNTVHAVGKLVLLVLLASILPKFGIFASWTLAVVVAVVVINFVIVRRLFPAHTASAKGSDAMPTIGGMARFVAADYAGAVAWIVSITVIPIAITVRLGGAENAFYSLAWVMALPLYTVASNTATSLVVSVVSDDVHRYDYSRRVFRQTARLVVPGALLLAVGAPYFLHLFGEEYAEEGTQTLRLLALSAIPAMVTSLYVAVWRAERRLGLLAAVRVVQFGIVAIVSLALIEPFGIVGPAVTWLVVQSIAAVVLVFFWPRVLLGHGEHPPRRLRFLFGLRNAAAKTGILAAWQWALGGRSSRRLRAGLERLAPSVLAQVASETRSSEDWIALKVLTGVTDKEAILVGVPDEPARAIIKVARSVSGAHTLEREAEALHELGSDPRLEPLRSLVPVVLARGELDGEAFVVESAVAGASAAESQLDVAALLEILAPPITELHRLTGREIELDATELERRVDRPLAILRRHYDFDGSSSWRARALDNVGVELEGSLRGRTLTVCRTHGDYGPGNVLLAPDSGAVTGIVDWEQSSADGIAVVDHAQLVLSASALVHGQELGEVVTRALVGRWDAPERTHLESASSSLASGAPIRVLVLLAWLEHATSLLTKSDSYATHRIWNALNIDTVMARLA